MSNFVEIIKRCENASGAGSKKIIQQALEEADQTARNLIIAALSPYAVYGVRKFDMPQSGMKSNTQSYSEFFCVLEQLATKQLTGDAARAAVSRALGGFSLEEQDYIVRVLDKDLKCGFSAETATKAWLAKGYVDLIPTFEVMLADKCEEFEDFEKYITFPCQADFKYDGCLSSTWTIELEDGNIVTIGEFVDKNMTGKVKSYNLSTRKTEWKEIVARIKNSMPERQYEWFELTLENGTILPPLTGNHRVWLPELKCWRRVDELQLNDSLFLNI